MICKLFFKKNEKRGFIPRAPYNIPIILFIFILIIIYGIIRIHLDAVGCGRMRSHLPPAFCIFAVLGTSIQVFVLIYPELIRDESESHTNHTGEVPA